MRPSLCCYPEVATFDAGLQDCKASGEELYHEVILQGKNAINIPLIGAPV